jgi:hypothetical protein
MSADCVPSSKTILELIRGAQCLIEVIRFSGEEMWRVDAYQIPYYSRGIEEAKRTHPRFVDCRLPHELQHELPFLSVMVAIG